MASAPSSDPDPPPGVRPATTVRVTGGVAAACDDWLAVEEPLDIRVSYGPLSDRRRAGLSVTMRTPGNDRELAAGFLFAEGVVADPADILRITAGGPDANTVRVELHPAVRIDLDRLARHTVTSSACGVCGKTSLAAVEAACDGPAPGGTVSAATVTAMPAALTAAQAGFAATGGVHAAGLFDLAGTLLAVREDVGRHNALDKLIGAEFWPAGCPWPAGRSWSAAGSGSSWCRRPPPPGCRCWPPSVPRRVWPSNSPTGSG